MFGVALAVAALDWAAVGAQRKRLEYLLKPATLVAIIIGLLLIMRGAHDVWQARFFLLGLVLSLCGDIFLMLPGDRFFLPGLVSFLLAHLCYIAGLNPTLPPLASLLFLVPVALVGTALILRVASALRSAGRTGLLIPVLLYGLVISVMLFSAWATLFRVDWSGIRRLLVVAGATLFFASDAMLAWNKFVNRFARADLAVIVAYHLGQLGLAASVALF